MKNLNLSFFKNLTDEDKILLNKVADWTVISSEKHLKKFSFFLDERQSALCDELLKSLCFSSYDFYGGFDDASRKVLCVYPEYDVIEHGDYPIKPLLFEYKKDYKLTHRDFLGALMSLNIARNTVGDIIVNDGFAQVYVYDTVCDMIIDSISKIGRVGVSIKVKKSEQIKPNITFEEINGTVASLRIDCLLSLVLHLSREKAKAIISSKGVVINHMLTYNADAMLNESDVFSVKGYGKFVVKSVNGISKKNRFHVTMCKYI